MIFTVVWLLGRRRKSSKAKIPKLHEGLVFEVEEDAERILEEASTDAETSADTEDPPSHEETTADASSVTSYKVDLHGMTLQQSKSHIDTLFAKLIGKGRFKVLIITGKGMHSKGEGNLLARDVHAHVSSKYASHILEIESSPDSVRVGGLPIRGHFEVVIG